jgi:hypothetical protein
MNMDISNLIHELRVNGVLEVSINIKLAAQQPDVINTDAVKDHSTEVKEVVEVSEETSEKKVDRPKRPSKKSLTKEEIKNIRKQFCPGCYTLVEIEEATGVTRNALVKHLGIGVYAYTHKTSGTKFYKLDDLYNARHAFETDILKNDGHRKGPVKFYADKLISLLDE